MLRPEFVRRQLDGRIAFRGTDRKPYDLFLNASSDSPSHALGSGL